MLPAPLGAVEFLARGERGAVLRVRPVPEMTAIVRPFDAGQIDFDMDLRELQGQERFDVLCDFCARSGARWVSRSW